MGTCSFYYISLLKPVGVLESGYPSIPNLCTGSCSTPRQGLPGDHQGPSWFLWSHSRTKYLSQGDKTPARGACREGQPRHFEELAATRHASRQGPVSDKLPGATRQRPRQGACRGKLTTLYPRSSASTNVSPWGLSRRAWREAMKPAVRGGMQDYHRGKRWCP